MNTSPNEALVDTAGLADRIRDAHAKCEAAVKQGLAHAIDAGNLLIEAKSLIDHGGWLSWLSDNCGVSERTAQAYMRVAKRAPELESKTQHVADLSLRDALGLLAEPRPEPTEVIANFATLFDEADRQLPSLRGRLDAATTIDELRTIIDEATDWQRRLIESRLRADRAAVQAASEVAGALKEIRDRKLYRDTHETFEDYCERRFGIEPRLLDMIDMLAPSAELEGEISDAFKGVLQSNWQAAMLAARSVHTSKSECRFGKASARKFAEWAGVKASTVTAYIATWNRAAADGYVPAAEELSPGQDVPLDGLPAWERYAGAEIGGGA